MTESMIVEAVRAACTEVTAPVARVEPVADPAAVERLAAALSPRGPDAVPFASEVSRVWGDMQGAYQTSLHRVEAFAAMSANHGLSAAHMLELQYEVANLSFQQELVTNIAKKASDAVSTLVKNG